MRLLLSLDLSTTCTGWSLFNMDLRGKDALLTYGTVKPKVKKPDQYTYPKQQMMKMISLCEQILIIIENYGPHEIVIEEIAGSRQRLGQKVLDGFHFVLVHQAWKYVDILRYYDVTGFNGWRTHLNLKLSEQDKINNKHAKKFNKEISGRSTRLPVIDAKDLACRYVNAKFGLALDPQVNQFDADIGDSISMGDAYLQFRCTKPKI